jgi:hypothetical protein
MTVTKNNECTGIVWTILKAKHFGIRDTVTHWLIWPYSSSSW